MTTTKNIQDLTDILMPTEYGRKITGIKGSDFQAIEQIYNELLIERINYIVHLLSEELDGFIQDYIRRFEIRNLSRILRGKASGVPPEEIRSWIIPLSNISEIDFETLLYSENIEEIINSLKGTPYDQLKGQMEIFYKYNTILPLEFALKATYYNKLMTHMSQIFSEAKSCKDIIGLEVDLTNCFTALTSLVYGYSVDLVESLLIDFPFQVTLSQFREAIKAKTAQAALNLLSPYSQVVTYILEMKDDLATAEGLRLLRNKVTLKMRENFMDFPYVIGYLILCELECRDLTCITLSLGYGFDPIAYLSYKI